MPCLYSVHAGGQSRQPCTVCLCTIHAGGQSGRPCVPRLCQPRMSASAPASCTREQGMKGDCDCRKCPPRTAPAPAARATARPKDGGGAPRGSTALVSRSPANSVPAGVLCPLSGKWREQQAEKTTLAPGRPTASSEDTGTPQPSSCFPGLSA